MPPKHQDETKLEKFKKNLKKTEETEALRRLRLGVSQHVRVEHVHINEGGQAVIGNVGPAGKWRSGNSSG